MNTRTYVTLSLSAETAAWIKQEAEKEYRTLSNYVNKLILEKMKAEQAQTR